VGDVFLMPTIDEVAQYRQETYNVISNYIESDLLSRQ